jgi:hypothetical protein
LGGLDIYVTLAEMAKGGETEKDRVMNFFVSTLEFFPRGTHVEMITDSNYLMNQWKNINDWAVYNLEGLDRSVCLDIWGDIERLLQEGRTVNMRLVRGEEFLLFDYLGE